jgi:hypothetical protein
MHINNTYNILSTRIGFKDTWCVIKGKRAPAGYAEKGAVVVSESNLSRDQAIELADKLESSIAA